MNIITHSRTDPNAPKHMLIGAFGSVLLAIGLYVLTEGIVSLLLGFVAGGFITGIVIELVQRVMRFRMAQNTIRESVLDALVTGCWPLIFYNMCRINNGYNS